VKISQKVLGGGGYFFLTHTLQMFALLLLLSSTGCRPCLSIGRIAAGSFIIVLSRGVESESPGVWVLAWIRSLSFEGDPTPGPICLIWTFVYFFAVCLTFVQFILQLKLCVYTVVHFLLEELKKLS